MPGLLRGVARTAVIAGTATAVSNRVSRRQATRWSQQGTNPYDQRVAWRRETRLLTAVAVPAMTAVRATPRSSPGMVYLAIS